MTYSLENRLNLKLSGPVFSLWRQVLKLRAGLNHVREGFKNYVPRTIPMIIRDIRFLLERKEKILIHP